MGNYIDKNGLSHLKSKIAAMIAARVITWSEIQGKPSTFAPSSHVHDVATTSANGFMSSADKTKLNGIATGANKYTLPTAGKNALGGVKTTSAVTSASGYTACPIIGGVVYYKDTNTTYTLASFGITATATELNKLDGATVTVTEINYLDGVTSNIQTQLDSKAPTTHKHNASDITSGTLPIERGGTGATTAHGVLTALGITATAEDINKLDGILYNVQEVLNSAMFIIKNESGIVTIGNLAEWIAAGKPKF